MAALNQKAFIRKLQHMSSAQDSVQTLSLWIIHHKKSASDIVKVWLGELKKCNPDRRLVLLYLANDVLQNSRKKGKEFSSAFAKVLREAIPLFCEKTAIRESVKRVLQIWQERKVFESDFIADLSSKISKADSNQSHHSKSSRKKEKEKPKVKEATKVKEAEKPASKPEKRLAPADFKPSKLIDALKAMRDFEAEVTLQESQLNQLRIDASDMEAIKQLKDRTTGARFTKEYEAASEKLEKFCGALEQEKKERAQLMSVVEDGDLYYDAAYGEVKVIVHAYKTFGNRLNSLKKKLDHKVDKLIQAEAEKKKMGPITTPQASFLSSGLPEISTDTPVSSPPQDTEEKKDKPKEKKAVDSTVDNTEVADMDLDDDSDSENGGTSETSSDEHKNSTSTQDSPVTTAATSVPKTTSSQSVATSSTPSSNSSTSSVNTVASTPVATVVASTSAVPVVIPVQLQTQAPMIMQRPTMQYMPGQPGIPMMQIGMPGQGTYVPMGHQYGMPSYGMVPGMNTMKGSMGLPIGVMPGMMPRMLNPQVPLQTALPGTMTGMSATHQITPGSAGISATMGMVSSQITTPLMYTTSMQPQGGAPLPQQATTITHTPVTSTAQAVSTPMKPPTQMYSPTRHGSISPSSERSAPSPDGSPELELGGDETPETASPREVVDMKIIGFPTTSSFINQESGKNSTDSPSARDDETAATSEEASAQSTNTPGTPDPTSDMSKPVSAVDILHRLLKRGKKSKDDEESASGTSTPAEEAPQTPPPQQSTQAKPLQNLIDSLFPKLTDSLNIIKAKEKENESTSTSEEGSPEAKIELNPMDDDDSEAEPHKEEPSTEEEDHDFSSHFQHHNVPMMEHGGPPSHNGPFPGQGPRPQFNRPWGPAHAGGPPSPHVHPGRHFQGPRLQRPPFDGQPKSILKSPKGGPYGPHLHPNEELQLPRGGPMNEVLPHIGPPRGGYSPRGYPPEEHRGPPHEGPQLNEPRRPSFGEHPGGPPHVRRPSEEPVSPHLIRGPPFTNGPRGPPGRPPLEGFGRPPHEGIPGEERPHGIPYPDGPRRPSLEGPHPGRPGPPGRPPYEPGRPPYEPGRPPYDSGRPPFEPGRPPFEPGRPPISPGRPPISPVRPGPPGRPPYEHERPLDEHGRPRFEPGRPAPPPEAGRPGPPARPPPYEPGRPGPGRGFPPGDRSPRGFVTSPGFDRREEMWRERLPPGPSAPLDRRTSAPEALRKDEANLWTSFEDNRARFPESERFRNPGFDPQWERQPNLGMHPRSHSFTGPEGPGEEYPPREHFLGKRPGPPFPYPGPPKRPYH